MWFLWMLSHTNWKIFDWKFIYQTRSKFYERCVRNEILAANNKFSFSLYLISVTLSEGQACAFIISFLSLIRCRQHLLELMEFGVLYGNRNDQQVSVGTIRNCEEEKMIFLSHSNFRQFVLIIRRRRLESFRPKSNLRKINFLMYFKGIEIYFLSRTRW